MIYNHNPAPVATTNARLWGYDELWETLLSDVIEEFLLSEEIIKATRQIMERVHPHSTPDVQEVADSVMFAIASELHEREPDMASVVTRWAALLVGLEPFLLRNGGHDAPRQLMGDVQ